MASDFLQEHNRLFNDLSAALNRDMAKLSSDANGGRSILFVYPPKDEEKYIEEARSRFTDGYGFIDLRELFVKFVESKGLEKFKQQYENMGTEVFVSQNYSDGTFFAYMMDVVQEVASKGLSPMIVHTVVIYKMGFSNQNIMENPVVMHLERPLVFFYPATLRNGTIYFLDKQPASKYRCVVVI